ncbi:MAG TPA: Uma2 family endonuclease [Polyangia bacterium]|nr:Uma2 family endonuclease [Polyangia bacterium]
MLSLDHLADLAPGRVRPLKRVEYERLVELGVFGEDDRIELLGGVLVEMTPQYPPHASTVQRLNRVLTRIAGERAELRPQLPFAASDESMPEPDFALVAPGRYDDAHPSAAFLIVEVADSSLRMDRRLKAEIYARAEVPEYWIVNLVDRLVEVHRQPRDGRYDQIFSVAVDGVIRPVALDGAEIRVADFLG